MFGYTNLGMIIAVKNCPDALQTARFTEFPCLFFILLCCGEPVAINGSEMVHFAPILVPMMMMLGYSPAFAQVI